MCARLNSRRDEKKVAIAPPIIQGRMAANVAPAYLNIVRGPTSTMAQERVWNAAFPRGGATVSVQAESATVSRHLRPVGRNASAERATTSEALDGSCITSPQGRHTARLPARSMSSPRMVPPQVGHVTNITAEP